MRERAPLSKALLPAFICISLALDFSYFTSFADLIKRSVVFVVVDIWQLLACHFRVFVLTETRANKKGNKNT